MSNCINFKNSILMKVAYILLTFLLGNLTTESVFMSDQKKFSRVQVAIIEKQKKIESILNQNNLEINNFNLVFVAYKDCRELEVYAKKTTETDYKKIDTYKVAALCSLIGPKKMAGDMKTPEGLYYIDTYNPNSQYYLSMGINYPNQVDRKKSNSKNLGGDIYIHGSQVTAGCLAMTDDKIKELYLYAINAKNNGQTRIPVYIFPFKMNDAFFEIYKNKHTNNPELIAFWSNLKEGHDKFMNEKHELAYTVDNAGNYNF